MAAYQRNSQNQTNDDNHEQNDVEEKREHGDFPLNELSPIKL